MLDEREAFLRAIFDAPDDDLPRLAYADWLEEHGEDLSARAIHLSLALARSSKASCDELDALLTRLRNTDERAANRLRGILRHEVSPDELFDEKGGELGVPILQEPGLLRQYVIDNPECFQYEWLTITGGHISDSRAFDAIFSTSAFRKVCELQLSGTEELVAGGITDTDGCVIGREVLEYRIRPIITQAGVEALATHRGAHRLTELDLRHNNLGNDALRLLTRSPHLENLRRLEIAEGNNFRGRVWQQLIERFGEDVVS